MLQFIEQYWLQVLFGLLISGGGLYLKHCRKVIARYKKDEKEEFHKAIIKEVGDKISTSLNPIVEKIDNIEETNKILTDKISIVEKGLLSVMGSNFKRRCEAFLQPEHEISLQEFNELQEDHEAYNALGGNHIGDQLFDLVCEKYSHTVG